MNLKEPERLRAVLKEREELVGRLIKALQHLPPEQQFSILTAWMSLDDLRVLVAFQERP